MTFNIFAIILVALYLMSIGSISAKFGNSKEGEYGWPDLIGNVLALILLLLSLIK